MLTGLLSELPLLGLLDRLAAANRTGVLRIEHSCFEACIYLESGQLIHAAVGELEGLAAMRLLTGLRKAPFRFESDAATNHRTLDSSLETYGQIAHYFEEWAKLNLSTDWGLLLHSDLLPGEAELNGVENTVLDLANGQRLAELLTGSAIDPIETAKVVRRLLQKGYLEAIEPIELKPEQLSVLTLYGSPKGVAVLDHALYKKWREQFKHGFVVRVKSAHFETTLTVESRRNFLGRVGLFDAERRKLKIGRGQSVDVWPEAV